MARLLLICSFFAAACAAGAGDLDKRCEKTSLSLGGKTISAYVADDDVKRERGLMYVEKLEDNTGMIFVFEHQRTLAFWMKNTLIPLSIGYFDEKGVLVDIQEMSVASSLMTIDLPSYPSKKPALFALEMNARWFARNKVHVGDRLFRHGPVKSTLLNERLASPSRR